jgi:hypothetical protein
LLPISEYDTLFNLIGTTHGGDGQSTFGLPDISNAPQYRNASGITRSGNSPPQDSFDLATDRGLAYFKAKLRWVTTAVYDLPFGKACNMLSQGPAAATSSSRCGSG